MIQDIAGLFSIVSHVLLLNPSVTGSHFVAPGGLELGIQSASLPGALFHFFKYLFY